METDLKFKIQEFLTSHNMKPYHFSQAAGISPSQLSRFLNDKGGLNWETAKKIIEYIDALGVPAKDILK